MKTIKGNEISAETYRRIIDGLQQSIETAADQARRHEAQAKEAGLQDIAEAAAIRRQVYEAIAERITHDLTEAAQEAEQHTGIEA